jgi:hypothetical protein
MILRNVVGAGLTGSKETDRHTVLLKFMTTKQGSSLLSDYQRTFTDQVSYLRAVGITQAQYGDDEVAMCLTLSLNSQFQSWRDELAKASLAEGVGKYPKTLAKAMELSTGYARILLASGLGKAPAKPIFSAEISTTEEPKYCMVANPRWKGKGTPLAKEAASAATA